jgi:hypothetical protein
MGPPGFSYPNFSTTILNKKSRTDFMMVPFLTISVDLKIRKYLPRRREEREGDPVVLE